MAHTIVCAIKFWAKRKKEGIKVEMGQIKKQTKEYFVTKKRR